MTQSDAPDFKRPNNGHGNEIYFVIVQLSPKSFIQIIMLSTLRLNVCFSTVTFSEYGSVWLQR